MAESNKKAEAITTSVTQELILLDKVQRPTIWVRWPRSTGGIWFALVAFATSIPLGALAGIRFPDIVVPAGSAFLVASLLSPLFTVAERRWVFALRSLFFGALIAALSYVLFGLTVGFMHGTLDTVAMFLTYGALFAGPFILPAGAAGGYMLYRLRLWKRRQPKVLGCGHLHLPEVPKP